MNRELITKDDKMYEIINKVGAHMFTNKDGSINQQVLGMYVHEYDGDRVMQREGQFLICKQIEEVTILQLDQQNNFRILYHMRKIREYRGCELESPLYRQIIAEKQANRGLHSTMSMPINEYKTKRGKYSNNNNNNKTKLFITHAH